MRELSALIRALAVTKRVESGTSGFARADWDEAVSCTRSKRGVVIKLMQYNVSLHCCDEVLGRTNSGIRPLILNSCALVTWCATKETFRPYCTIKALEHDST
jgi:hypothetical protein